MKAFIVTIRPGSADRYTDSVWLSPAHANERVADLVDEFQRRGKGKVSTEATNEGWATWVSPITIQDGYIPVPSAGKVAKK